MTARFLIAALLLRTLFPATGLGAEKPNLVMVFIDDMGWSDLSCFGGKAVETQHIDRLAAEGMGAKLLPLTMTPDSDQPGRIWEKAVILGEPVTWMQRSEITGAFVNAALGFIDEAAKKEQPFFVNLWPDDVHGPWFPPVARWGDDKRALYHAVLDTMDEQLAPLFDRIRDDAALRDNTLILFCSDNGHEEGAGNSDPLRGAKTWLYDLETDASESANLAAAHPDIVARLRAALFEWNSTLPADAGDPAYRP